MDSDWWLGVLFVRVSIVDVVFTLLAWESPCNEIRMALWKENKRWRGERENVWKEEREGGEREKMFGRRREKESGKGEKVFWKCYAFIPPGSYLN